ncbi:hypothetical protein [Bifidobacterium aquikefiri]|jgi:hypothetical protein|uniref:hypothetical protein n=1 Tax=Bifidobacterium aquikefiri TaxID=1653207 RepID=UPI0039E74454
MVKLTTGGKKNEITDTYTAKKRRSGGHTEKQTLMLPTELLTKLRMDAAIRRVSLSGIVTEALAQYYEQKEDE